MKPFIIKPNYLEKVWAGDSMSQIHSDCPPKTGIAWELSAHKNASNIISSGEFEGENLRTLIANYGAALTGTNHPSCADFPIRLALMDAAESLSVQVHPDQKYAQSNDNDNGKNEIWYILDASENASIIAGVKTADSKAFVSAIKDQTLEDLLVYIPVKKGDLVNIPQGLVHALGGGIVALEVGQNSDTTYRIYDYDRGRPLDIEKSMDVIDLNLETDIIKYNSEKFENYTYHHGFDGKPYTVDVIDVHSSFESQSNNKYFESFTCLEGRGILSTFDQNLEFSSGDTIFVPASTGKFLFAGSTKLLRAFTR